MNKKEVTDKGVFTWGAFTAIMIIVVCAAVLVFIFKVKVGDEKQHPTLQINENVITINEIDRGIIKTEDGNDIVIDNTTNEELPVEEIENDNLVI